MVPNLSRISKTLARRAKTHQRQNSLCHQLAGKFWGGALEDEVQTGARSTLGVLDLFQGPQAHLQGEMPVYNAPPQGLPQSRILSSGRCYLELLVYSFSWFFSGQWCTAHCPRFQKFNIEFCEVLKIGGGG